MSCIKIINILTPAGTHVVMTPEITTIRTEEPELLSGVPEYHTYMGDPISPRIPHCFPVIMLQNGDPSEH